MSFEARQKPMRTNEHHRAPLSSVGFHGELAALDRVGANGSIAKQSQHTKFGPGGKHKLSTQPHEANCLHTSVGLAESLRAPTRHSRLQGVPSRPPPKPNPMKLLQISANSLKIIQILLVSTRCQKVAALMGCLERSVVNPVVLILNLPYGPPGS